jgi:hypothetical protein
VEPTGDDVTGYDDTGDIGRSDVDVVTTTEGDTWSRNDGAVTTNEGDTRRRDAIREEEDAG